MVPVLKEMILTKELQIIANTPSDNKNDSDSSFENNIK
jgi:hypothetical protein